MYKKITDLRLDKDYYHSEKFDSIFYRLFDSTINDMVKKGLDFNVKVIRKDYEFFFNGSKRDIENFINYINFKFELNFLGYNGNDDVFDFGEIIPININNTSIKEVEGVQIDDGRHLSFYKGNKIVCEISLYHLLNFRRD